MAKDKDSNSKESDVTKLGNAPEKEQAKEPEDQTITPKASESEPADPRDDALRNYRQFDFKSNKRAGVVDDPNVVGNVAADRCTTWATDPRFDSGQHLGIVKGLGFRPVEEDEVSRDPNKAGKMYVAHYDIWNGYVMRGGGMLMIGYKQYRDERRTAARVARRQELDESAAKLNNQGIEQERKTRRGSLAEVQT